MGTADSESWKAKYMASLDKLERRERHFQEIEELLRAGISRVALAAQGVDRNLDRDLTELRKIVRRGKAYEGLHRIVDAISDSVKQLEDGKSAVSHNTQANCLLELVSQLDVGERFQKQKQQIEKSLTKLRADQSVDRCLQQTVELCNSVLTNNLPAPKKSWIHNFFGPSEDSIELHYEAGAEPPQLQFSQKSDPRLPLLLLLRQLPDVVLSKKAITKLEQTLVQLEPPIAPQNALSEYSSDMQKVLNQSLAKITALMKKHASANNSSTGKDCAAQNSSVAGDDTHQEHRSADSVEKFCIQLLESLSFPEEFQVSVNALRSRILGGLESAEISGVVHALADLVMATRAHIESERNELQGFLLQLNSHLDVIGNQVGGMQTIYVEDVAQRQMLTNRLSEQMQHLQSSAQQAGDLSALKTLIREQVIGIRQNIEKQNEHETKRQQKLAEALAKSTLRLQQLEQESSELRQRLSEKHAQAIHDALTGIHNRLAYQERIDQEYLRWKRYRKPLSMVLFDIDHFKRINDKYGHKAGDKTLRMIAKYLLQMIRETDFVARYGGEEFIVIMPETSVDEAVLVANKLREKIAEVYFHYGEEKVAVSVSAGIAAFSEKDTVDSVFQRADQALYQAKRNGRNRCVSGED